MMVGYFDESGLDQRSRTVCIGGYVADSCDWFELGRAWCEVLADSRIDCFHMVDFENRQGEFKNWSNEKRFSFIKEVVSLINSLDVWGIGAGVVKVDYELVSTELAVRKPDRPLWWQDPYLFAFYDVIVETCIRAENLAPSEKIAFIFDQQFTYEGRAQKIYRDLQGDGPWPRSFRLGSLEFCSKREVIGLQVADLLAYELRKALDHKLYEPSRAARKSMVRLKRRPINPHYFNEAALRLLVRGRERQTPVIR